LLIAANSSRRRVRMRTVRRVEDITPRTPRPVRRRLLVQRWADVAFLHWRVEQAVVAPLLPAGTRPDTLDGSTYVGLIAFRLGQFGFGTFGETNVRLYSVDARGRRAVVFRSMEAGSLPFVLAARVAMRLPYMWSRMRVTGEGDVRTYVSHRRWPGPASARTAMSVRVGPPIAEPGPLEHFLTARWGLHTRAWGGTRHFATDHPAWPLHHATLLSLDDTLIAAAGLPAPATPPASVLYSPGVPVVFG
jgi:uncharacterized protein YqjF (DUF2071 family)